jgi:hypothetical protein
LKFVFDPLNFGVELVGAHQHGDGGRQERYRGWLVNLVAED